MLRLELLWHVLLLAKAALLSKAILLLSKAVLLLSETALLLAIHLASGSANLRSTDGHRLVGSAQQHILLVHHRVVDELPLVVGFLLVVNANRGIFTQAGDTDDCPATKLRIAASGVLSEGRITLLIAATGLVAAKTALLVIAQTEALIASRLAGSGIAAGDSLGVIALVAVAGKSNRAPRISLGIVSLTGVRWESTDGTRLLGLLLLRREAETSLTRRRHALNERASRR